MAISIKYSLCLSLISILNIFDLSYGCGIITHIEISHRTVRYFQDDSGGNVDYGKLMQKHPDALIAGSPYPDAYYDSICHNGQYHDVSEDTHWAPFLKTAVDYIRQKYPQPWDEATEKLVVFLFGIVSHQVADIVWHSLGIDQGFLQTMDKINFHGIFDTAHHAGDFGGDVLTTYQMNLDYIPLVEGWYIPTQDLYNIYSQYYNRTDKMPTSVIVECSSIMYLARLGEHLALKEVYRETAEKSPFLVDQFENYFLGGVGDMAGWTDRLWHETVTMLEKGTDICSMPKSTLFVHCNTTSSKRQMSGYRDPGKNGFYVRPSLKHVSKDDFTVEKELRGVRIKPSQKFMERMKKKLTKAPKTTHQKKNVGSNKVPDKVFYVKQEYSRLGDQYASGDLNSDGYEDLVITAPGYGRMGSPQEGRVYIIHGTKDGIGNSVNPDLDDLEIKGQGQILKGWGTAQSRFGTSVAVLDINLDGADDIAIGAPALVLAGDSPLKYNGNILIYFGIPSKRCVAYGAANITLACEKSNYCNLGITMTTSDVDGDGHQDLVFGSPVAPAGGEQRGMVSALLASKMNTGYQYIDVTQLPWTLQGNQNYSWFGYGIFASKWFDSSLLFINQPEFRKCALANCSYVSADKQAVGRVTAYGGVNQSKLLEYTGVDEFEQLGWSVDVGTPFPDKNNHVLAISALGAAVKASVADVGVEFSQVGQVVLLNSTSKDLPRKTLSVIQGDRSYERFGSKIKFIDVNRDGLGDLVIGAPFRSEDFTEELQEGEEGHVYIYFGGENFPVSPSKADCGNSFIRPCPQYQADLFLTWTSDKANERLGSNFFAITSYNKTELFVTAQHSRDFARSAGAIGLFTL